MSSNRLLHQERIPWGTLVSLGTTVMVEAIIVIFSGPETGLAALGGLLLNSLAVTAGCLINLVAGVVAYKRREFWGGRIAVLGIVLWLASLAALRA